MEHSYPVFTIDAECQDCYKCVRHCPVKAIRVHHGHATVVPELCVACGRCVEVCPVRAKQVRNDTGRARLLLNEPAPVYVSLAPSWVNEFAELSSGQMIRALKLLGVTGVSETALGAQIVSGRMAAELESGAGGLMLSSACPSAADFICKYLPELADSLTQVGSPLMAHCRLLRDIYGADIKIAFIGPCISKKNEADRRPELLNLALTFLELKQLFRDAGIAPEKLIAEADDKFVPEEAEEGVRYPIEGGMNDTIAFQCANPNVHYATLTGIENIKMALDGMKADAAQRPIFVEMLACAGGCVHGPCTEHVSPGLLERLRVLDNAKLPNRPRQRQNTEIAAKFTSAGVADKVVSGSDVTAALRSIGKVTPEDELNCDGCGYDTCRNFAHALVAGRAEPSMCVSFLRKQAQKKANALLRSIPSSVVIADRNLNIIECNRNFATLFGADTLDAFEASPGLAGADLRRIVPFYQLFESALQSGEDIKRDSLKFGKRVLRLNIFTIDPREVIGGVFIDITQTEWHREQIASRARQVIENNIATVQEIACRLGEQMADTEVLLRSIADDYADDGATPSVEIK